MIRITSYLSTLLVLSLLLYSCDSNPSKSVSTSDKSKGKGYADLILIDDFFDFGSIAQGEVVSHTFRFKNGGSDILVIKDLIPDCGCTKPKIDKKVLKPNEEGRIEVIFDSKGWQGSHYKSVALRTNSPIKEKSVTIKANVVPNKE